MLTYVFVAIAGAIGSVLRYVIGVVMNPLWFGSFPAATFSANVVGCFFLAYFTASFAGKKRLSVRLQTALTTGLIGSFTTFSTFSVETVILFRDHSPVAALLYVITSGMAGFLFAVLGFLAGNQGKPKGVGRW